ncbi:MAG: glutathione S-transferase [Methylobacterium mesophilicum]|nr:glutathione S-transferase [Methylobacterium mesophilicum]
MTVVFSALGLEDATSETCPWSAAPIAGNSLMLYKERVVGFCDPGCKSKFEAAVEHFEAALATRGA